MRATADAADRATDSFAEVLGQFAALNSYAPSAVGGYRTLQPVRALPDFDRSRALTAMANARMRLTGFLSVIFVGALGLVVLAGPSSCACAVPSVPTQHTAATEGPAVPRFAYTQPASLAAAELAARFSGELPPETTVALLQPEETIGVSSISTSAIGRVPRDPAERRDDLAPQRTGRLPANVEPLADVAPASIRVAAASPIESDVVDTLPAVVVDSPQIPNEVAAEAEREHTAKVRSRTASRSKPRRPSKVLGYKTGILPASTKGGQTPPRWAQKMFDNPWQARAFSYQ